MISHVTRHGGAGGPGRGHGRREGVETVHAEKLCGSLARSQGHPIAPGRTGPTGKGGAIQISGGPEGVNSPSRQRGSQHASEHSLTHTTAAGGLGPARGIKPYRNEMPRGRRSVTHDRHLHQLACPCEYTHTCESISQSLTLTSPGRNALGATGS